MESKVVWSRKSEDNLERIFQFIAQDSEVYARRFVKDLIIHVEDLLNSKISVTGRMVPEFQNTNLAFLREIIYRGYRIIYDSTNDDSKIQIVVVISGRENIYKHT